MSATACVAAGPSTCERCQLRARRCGGRCDDLCRLLARLTADPSGHEAWHAAQHCRRCGTDKYDADGEPAEVARLCKRGHCRTFHCRVCDEWLGSDGPLACPCNSGSRARLLLRWWDWRDRRRARRAGVVARAAKT